MKCGTLYTCSGGKTYVLTLDSVINPYSTKPFTGSIISTSTIKGPLSTYEIMNVLDQIIGTDLTTTQIPAYTAGTLTVNSIIRSVTSVDAETKITIDMTLTNRIEKNAIIEVQIPFSQFLANGNTPYY